MKFERAIKLISEDKKIVLYVDEGTAYGMLHDFLMHAKGITVENMNKAQKEEEAAVQKVKEADAKKLKEKQAEQEKK